VSTTRAFVTKLIEYTTSESAPRASQVIGNLGHHHTVARCKARTRWAGVAVVSYFVLGEQVEVLLSATGSAFDSKAFEGETHEVANPLFVKVII
jgi:hypothetical protein